VVVVVVVAGILVVQVVQVEVVGVQVEIQVLMVMQEQQIREVVEAVVAMKEITSMIPVSEETAVPELFIYFFNNSFKKNETQKINIKIPPLINPNDKSTQLHFDHRLLRPKQV
jgi:hypothetical protein